MASKAFSFTVEVRSLRTLNTIRLKLHPSTVPRAPSKFEVCAPGTLYPILESVRLSQRCLDRGGEGRAIRGIQTVAGVDIMLHL